MTAKRVVAMSVGTLLLLGSLWAQLGGPLPSEAVSAARTDRALPADAAEPQWTAGAARAARTAHYLDLTTLAQALELPSDFARNEALYIVAGRADAGALRDLIAEANRLGPERERLAALDVLLLRYVEIDPRAALRAALAMDRTAAARLVPLSIGAWSRSDLAAAASAGKELPDEALRTAAAHAILQRHAAGDEQQSQLAKEAGEALVDLALGQPDAAQRRRELTDVASAWASLAPEEAWEHAARISDAASRMAFQNAVISVWAAEQPAAAFARVMELPAEWQREQLLRDITAELVRRDPRMAIELTGRLQGSELEKLQVLIASEWSRIDPSAAAHWIDGHDRSTRDRLAYQVYAAYLAQKPDEALAWAQRISRSSDDDLWANMLISLAEKDPGKALRLALAAENPSQRTHALSGIVGVIAATDPALAMRQLDELPPGQARLSGLMQIGWRIGVKSPQTAVEWLKSLDPQQRARAAGVMVSRIGRENIEVAVQLLEEIPQDAHSTWIEGIGSAYARQDPELGRRWVRRFEGDPAYPSIVANFSNTLAMQSPREALGFIASIPDGAQREQVLANTLPSIVWASPETAAQWTTQITEPRARARAIAQVASTWASYDYANSKQWVTSLADSRARDGGLAQLAVQSQISLDEALSLVGQIQSPDQRANAVYSKAMQLAQSEPESARTLLRRYPLDPRRQQQLESEIGERTRAR